jgi:hypothetical protein
MSLISAGSISLDSTFNKDLSKKKLREAQKRQEAEILFLTYFIPSNFIMSGE